MKAWNADGLVGQPHAIVLDRSGRERGRRIGAFDPAEAVDGAWALPRLAGSAASASSLGGTRTSTIIPTSSTSVGVTITAAASAYSSGAPARGWPASCAPLR